MRIFTSFSRIFGANTVKVFAAFCLTVVTTVFLLVSHNSPTVAALTTTPTTMNFQGRLTTAAGAVVADGLYNMKFALYDAASAGTLKWSETRETTTRVQVTNGLFTTKLGEATPLDPTIFASGSLYFQITMATPATANCSTAACASWESPMTSRSLLSTSAYAYNSETLDGLDSAAFGQLSANNTWTGTNLVSATSTTAFKVQSATGTNALTVDTTNGRLTTQDIMTSGISLYPWASLYNNVYWESGANHSIGGGYGTDSWLDATTGIYNFATAYATNPGDVITENSVMTIANNGATTFKNAADSTAAFKIQSASGADMFNVDTTNSTVQLGQASPKLGYSVNGALTDSGSRNVLSMQSVSTGSTTRTVNSISFYVGNVDSAPNNKAQVAIYSDYFGSPMDFIVSSGDITLTGNALNTVALSASLDPNTTYWLVYNTNASSDAFNNLKYDDISTTKGGWTGYTYGTWPDPMSGTGGSNTPGVTRSIYANTTITSGVAMVVNDKGYVGINTANPQTFLSVNGGVSIQGDAWAYDPLGAGQYFSVTRTDPRYQLITADLNNGTLQLGQVVTVQGNFDNQVNAFGVKNVDSVSLFNVDVATTSTNLVTNSGFEFNTTGWTQKGTATLTRDNWNYAVGSWSMDVVTSAANSGAKYAYTFAPNTTYTLSFNLAASATNNAVSIGRQDNGVDIDCLTGLTVTTANSNRFDCTFTTGSTISGSNIYVKTGSGKTLYLDEVQLVAGSAPYSYGKLSLNGVIDTTTTFRNARDSNASFQVQNAAGVSLLTADTLNNKVVLGASTSLTLTGGDTASRPASPTEGMLYYDSETKQFLVYSNGAWQADSRTTTKVVGTTATGGASSAVASLSPGGADYVNASTTSAQTVINSALSAASSTGGTVYLMEGTYIIDGPINIPNKVTLAGAGNGTIIKLKNSTNADVKMLTNTDGTTGTRIGIRDLTIEGNKANQSSGNQYGIYLLNMGGSGTTRDGAKISNVYISNTLKTALYLDTSSNNTITGVTIKYADNNGIQLNAASNNILSNNTIQASVNSGINLINASNKNTITGNLSQSNLWDGLDLAGSHNNTVTGNTFEGNSETGIYDNDGDTNVFTGNQITNNLLQGILLDNTANDNTVSGNKFNDNGNTTKNDSIMLQASDHNSITGNDITEYSGCTVTCYVINIVDSASNDNYLSDNRFSSYASAPSIQDLGTNTVYANQSRASDGGQLTTKNANSTTAYQIQNASGSNVFDVDTVNGRVGIGTVPVEQLHIAALNTSGRILTKIENTNAAASSKSSGIQLAGGTTIDWTISTDVALNGSNNFAIQDNKFGYQPRLMIDSSGQVGFGTDTPTASLSFSSGADKTVNVNAAGAGVAGNKLTITAGASGSGAVNGGDLILQAGASGGSGTSGSVVIKANGTNSATAFQVQNAAGSTAIGVNTVYPTNNIVTNGSFEQNVTGWTNSGAGFSVAQDTSTKQIGSASMQVPSSATANTGAKYPVTLTQNHWYAAEFYVRTSGSSYSTLTVGYSYNGAANPDNCVSGEYVSTGWTHVTCTFKVTNAISGSPYFYIQHSDAVAHTFWVDAVSLYDTGNTGASTGYGAPAYADSLLSLNGKVVSPLVVQTTEDTYTSFAVQGANTAVGFNDYLFKVDSVNLGVAINGSTVEADLTLGGFGGSSNSTIAQATNWNGAGKNLTMRAGNAGSGATNGGNLVLSGGAKNGAGTGGSVIIKPQASNDSTGAFQVQNAAGTALMTMDTTNAALNLTSVVNVNGLTPPSAPTIAKSAGGTLNGTYYYRVAAVNAAGRTNSVNTTPTNLASDGTNKTITVSWSAITGATGYYVYRSANAGVTWYRYLVSGGSTVSLVDNGTTPAWTDTSSTYANDIYASTNSLLNINNNGQIAFNGGNAGISTSATTHDMTIGNYAAGTGVILHGDYLTFADTTGYNNNFNITNTGATTFTNRTNSSAAFRIQNSSTVSLFTVDTSAARIYVGPTAGDTVGTLLVLGNKTDAGDPTGVNGAMYYNSSTHTFRCYRDSFWERCGVNPIDRGYNIEDDFVGGAASTDGAIGNAGWSRVTIGSASTVFMNSASKGLLPSTDHPGVLDIETAATTNSGTTLTLANTSGSGSVVLAAGQIVKTTVSVGNVANPSQVLRVGLHNETTATTAPTTGVWWEVDPTSTDGSNWRYCFVNTGAPTCTSSGVAASADHWERLEIRIISLGSGTSAVTFVINGTVQTPITGQTINTTNAVNPAFTIYTQGNTARHADMDYFQFRGVTSAVR